MLDKIKGMFGKKNKTNNNPNATQPNRFNNPNQMNFKRSNSQNNIPNQQNQQPFFGQDPSQYPPQQGYGHEYQQQYQQSPVKNVNNGNIMYGSSNIEFIGDKNKPINDSMLDGSQLDVHKVGGYNPYTTIEEEMIRTRKKPPEQPQNRFGRIEDAAESVKEMGEANPYLQDVSKISKKGLRKAEEFVVGDAQVVKREKRPQQVEIEEDYRISIKEVDEAEQGVVQGKQGLFKRNKLKRNENNKRRAKAKEEREQTISKNYEYLRKEFDGYSPLYNLDFLDKIRVARRYMDEKSGKIAKREAEKFQKEQRKRIEAQSLLKRKLTETLEPVVQQKIKNQKVEIVLPKGEEGVVDYVLSQDYFSIFEIRKTRPNPNLKIYNLNVPIVLTFSLKGVEIEME